MKNLLILALLITGCSSAVLSTPGKIHTKQIAGMELRCAVINEFDTSTVRKDKNKKGCWCSLPPSFNPGIGMVVPFVMVKDHMCQPDSKKEEKL